MFVSKQKRKKMKMEVKFTKTGNNIKYELPVEMWCTRMKKFIANSNQFDLTDIVYSTWLGNEDEINELFKDTDVIYKTVELSVIYDSCDKPVPYNY